MANARRDDNRVTTLLGVSSVDGVTPIPLQVDPATGRLQAEFPGAGTGDVVGPASATNNEIARFDGITGKLLKDSGVVSLTDIGLFLSTGAIAWEDVYWTGSTWAGKLILSSATSEWDTFKTNFGEVSLLNAINQAAGGGTGDVVGPASSTDTAIVRFDGTTGKLIQDSVLTLSATGVIQRTGGTVTLGTGGGGDVALISSGNVVFQDVNKGSSTFTTQLVLSDNAGEWNTFETNFGEVSLLNAINQAAAGGGITQLTGDVTAGPGSGSQVATIAAKAVDIAMLADGTAGQLITWDVAGVATTVATGTAGQLLTSNGAGAAPTFQTYTGSTSVTTLGTITTGTWNGTDIAVADGGTGVSSFTAYAVICGGTTATGPLQNVAGLGTSGQVLTSNGAGTLPTWQAATGGGNTLDAAYDQGGAGVGRAITTDAGAVTMTTPVGANNACLELTQNNTTNDPNALTVTNAANGTAVEILQNGVLNASEYGLRVYSNAVQTASPLVIFHQDNVSSTADVMSIQNDGTGDSLLIDHNGTGMAFRIDHSAILAASHNVVEIVSSAANNVPNLPIHAVVATNAANQNVVSYVEQGGTGRSFQAQNEVAWAVGEVGVFFNTLVAQTNNDFFQIKMDHASSTARLMRTINDGTGTSLYIDHNNEGICLVVDQNGFAGSTADHVGIDVSVLADSTAAAVGITFDIANAVPGGNEFAFRFTGAEHDTAAHGGTAAGRIRILDGTAVRYIYMYSN